MDAKNRQRRLRIRSFKYAVLSMMLAVILLTTTGCAALLIGNDRKAYNLMVEAADYFRYPSSVQIDSGEIYGDALYCIVRAKNGFGYDVSDTYCVTDSGYPLKLYDSRCYSHKLNCGLINNALAMHFGNLSTNSLGNLIGGTNMSAGGVIVFYIILIIVLLCLNGLLASNASDIAYAKGYGKQKWFHMCFWLGPISYIIIAAMPDLQKRAKQDKTNELLEKMINSCSNPAAEKRVQNQQAQSQNDDISSYLPEL